MYISDKSFFFYLVITIRMKDDGDNKVTEIRFFHYNVIYNNVELTLIVDACVSFLFFFTF